MNILYSKFAYFVIMILTLISYQTFAADDVVLVEQGNLCNVLRYNQGPCSGKCPNNECKFDTRSVFRDKDNKLVESITAYGRYWNWTQNGSEMIAWPDNGSYLYLITRYNQDQQNGITYYGPCYNKGVSCKFDTRTIFRESSTHVIESVTAYNKFWNWRIEF